MTQAVRWQGPGGGSALPSTGSALSGQAFQTSPRTRWAHPRTLTLDVVPSFGFYASLERACLDQAVAKWEDGPSSLGPLGTFGPLPTSSLMLSYHKHRSKTALVPVFVVYIVSKKVLKKWAGRGILAAPWTIPHLGPDPAQESDQLSFTPLGVSVAALAVLNTHSAEA